nr:MULTISPECIES: Msa family membrane protein [Staphylococcus]
MILAYISPLLLNGIVNILGKERNRLKYNLIYSGITTICYFIFSVYFISRPEFPEFVSENSRETGSVSIQINTELANIDQLIFVFLLNFVILFLIDLSKRKKGENDTSKECK